MEVRAEEGWIKKSGDTMPCFYCKEPIFGYRYIMVYEVMGETIETKVQLCESCYELKDDPTRR
jgi:hypothetical protein